MTSALTGWDITEWMVAVAAFLTAGGVIHQKVVKPVRAFWRVFKMWMVKIEVSTAWTEQQMRENSGSSLVDKVDLLRKQVSLLLKHDAERDRAGMRYSDPDTTEGETP